MLQIDDLTGLWRRSLLVLPDGFRDTTTQVHWLQGPSLYVDLRQGAGRPGFAGVRCLRDLTRDQVLWLAGQDGFAGTLRRNGAYFEWLRALDFRPSSPSADAGRLWLEDGIMKEEGRDVPYVEHWHREPGEAWPVAGLALGDPAGGAAGSLVVVGSAFMYARARARMLPAGAMLPDLVRAAASLEEAQDLVDCEISAGTIADGIWTVVHSTLPFKEGQAVVFDGLARDAGPLSVEDSDAEGRPFTRRWSILAREGDPGAAVTAPGLLRASS